MTREFEGVDNGVYVTVINKVVNDLKWETKDRGEKEHKR